MQHPLFSVLIANYNNGIYLEEALQSVFSQTYTNWEIILVDDASTDNSKEIYQKYSSDTRIHIYYNDKNYGCGYTKHRCAELANGEICGFLDPDDIILPEALESHLELFNKNAKLAIVYSNCYLCDEQLNIIQEHRMSPIPQGESFFSTHQYFGPANFCSFRNECYQKTTKISNFEAGIDQELYLKVEEQGDIAVLDKFTYMWRQTKKSVSRGNPLIVYWNLIVFHETCVRRNLEDAKYVLPILVQEGLNVETVKKQAKANLDAAYNSMSYKLGNFILKPLSLIKRILFKHMNTHYYE